ncbi:arp2/3 complex [Salix suchowensis]|nr:arp2/3 complex [Salix suchowensis]
MDTAFRKIDIDIYDEDILQESELYEPFPQDAAQALNEAKQRQSAVRGALAKCVREHFFDSCTPVDLECRGDVPGALSIALENAPYGPNVEDAKVLTLQTILTILNSTKSTEVSSVIKALSQDSQDALMKYLYKGMAMPGWGDISGSVLLGWHEKHNRFSASSGAVCRSLPLTGKVGNVYLAPELIGVAHPCAISAHDGAGKALFGYPDGKVGLVIVQKAIDHTSVTRHVVPIISPIDVSHTGSVLAVTWEKLDAGKDGGVRYGLALPSTTRSRFGTPTGTPFTVSGLHSRHTAHPHSSLWKPGLQIMESSYAASQTAVCLFGLVWGNSCPRLHDLLPPDSEIRGLAIECPVGRSSNMSPLTISKLVLDAEDPEANIIHVLVAYQDDAGFYRISVDTVTQQTRITSFDLGSDTLPGADRPVLPISSGSSTGEVKVWDSLNFALIREFGPRKRGQHRAEATYDEESIGQILLTGDKQVLVFNVGDRVVGWWAGPDRKGYRGGVRDAYALRAAIDEFRDLTDDVPVPEGVLERRQNEREQRVGLASLGLSEAEAVEYVLMLSRDNYEEEYVERYIGDVEEGVFDNDFELDGVSHVGAASPAQVLRRLLRRSRLLRPHHHGRVLDLLLKEVSPRMQDEPREAGPTRIGKQFSGGSESSKAKAINIDQSEQYFPVMGGKSGTGSPSQHAGGTPKSRGSPSTSKSPSAWSKPLATSKLPEARGMEQPDKGKAKETKTPDLDDMDDDLRFAIELSLAEAASRECL